MEKANYNKFYIEIENKRFELEKEDVISQKEKKVKFLLMQ